MFPLAIENMVLRRRGKTILGPLSLTLEAPGITVVIGPNGAGKTSFLRALHGIEKISEGTVSWTAPKDAVRRAQTFVSQKPILLRRSVLGNLIYPLQLTKTPRQQAKAQAGKWARRIQLNDVLHMPARRLSGGEQQKLALARALIRDPQVLFLDEPTASLDGRATREIEDLLKQIAAQGTHIIMSTHHMAQAQRLADNVIFLHKGRVMAQETAQLFFQSPPSSLAAAFINGDIIE